jgi:hypothetical protein
MIQPRIKIGYAARGKRELQLTLKGNTLTWSPREPMAASWAVKIYDLSGLLLDDGGFIDGDEPSADIRNMWDPSPFQVSIQAQDGEGVNFGPESNKVAWHG